MIREIGLYFQVMIFIFFWGFIFADNKVKRMEKKHLNLNRNYIIL